MCIRDRQKVEQTGKILDQDGLKRLTDRGLLKESVVEKIEHPDSVDLKYFSEHKINDLILQVTQQCNLRCRYCSYSGLYNNRTHSSERMDFTLAKKAIDKLQELTVDPNMLSWKVPMLYYEGLFNYVTGDPQTGMTQIQKAKQIYHLCGNEFMVEHMETGLKFIQGM